MKANRREIQGHLANDDHAVSPVIATILMVAVTVVLAAVVYFYVSGFGANQPQALSNVGFTSKASSLPGATGATSNAVSITYSTGPPGLTGATFKIDDATPSNNPCSGTPPGPVGCRAGHDATAPYDVGDTTYWRQNPGNHKVSVIVNGQIIYSGDVTTY